MTEPSHLAYSVAQIRAVSGLVNGFGISRRAAELLVDSIVQHYAEANPEQWDADRNDLTDEGHQEIRPLLRQVAELNIGRREDELVTAVEAAANHIREYTAARDMLICIAMGTQTSRTKLAAATGLTPGRLYQIRDEVLAAEPA